MTSRALSSSKQPWPSSLQVTGAAVLGGVKIVVAKEE
jgi:hypothetical protein